MSILEWRGGIPAVFLGTGLTTTPVEIVIAKHLERMDPAAQTGRYSRGVCKWMRVQNLDVTNALRLYFFFEHADAGIHYVTIPPAVAGFINVWEGPVEAKRVWVAADTITVAAYEITAFMRRA